LSNKKQRGLAFVELRTTASTDLLNRTLYPQELKKSVQVTCLDGTQHHDRLMKSMVSDTAGRNRLAKLFGVKTSYVYGPNKKPHLIVSKKESDLELAGELVATGNWDAVVEAAEDGVDELTLGEQSVETLLKKTAEAGRSG
jgi:hypothetical protein